MELHHLSNSFPLNRSGYFLTRTKHLLRARYGGGLDGPSDLRAADVRRAAQPTDAAPASERGPRQRDCGRGKAIEIKLKALAEPRPLLLN